MKKLFAILLAVTMLASVAAVASAANTTTLTTTVPAATYTLNIPADQEISFGATSTNIGAFTVSDEEGFAVGKNLKVTITYDAFTCEGVSTTIPMSVQAYYENNTNGTKYETVDSGAAVIFKGTSTGDTSAMHDTLDMWLTKLYVKISSEDWGKALAGEYTATITFTAEVVAGE